MRTADMQALGEVAAEGLTVLNNLIRGMHSGIAGRVFASIGPAAKPVETVHDAIAGTVYDLLGAAGHRLPPALSSFAAAGLAFDDDAALDEHPRLAEFLAALDGIYGDELAERGSPLAPPMTLRVSGRPEPQTPDALRAAKQRPPAAKPVFA